MMSAYIMTQMIPKFYTTDTVCTVERVIIKDVRTYSWDDDYMVKAVVSPPVYPKVHPRKFSAYWKNTLATATRMAEQYANGTMHWCKVRLGTRSIPQLKDMTAGPESELIIPVIVVIVCGICIMYCSLRLLFEWIEKKDREKKQYILLVDQSNQVDATNTAVKYGNPTTIHEEDRDVIK